MIRRFCACLLAAVLMLPMWIPALAEDEAGTVSPEADQAADFSMRFGMNAVVEADEDGTPVSVNGYPFRSVETSINVRGVDEKIIGTTDFTDYPFWRPATEYDGNLAIMSLVMALCAARDIRRDEDPHTFDPARNVVSYLENAGFADIRKDDYSKETSLYTISTAMGFRRMEHEGEEPFTLIAVGVCGGGYGNEWQSNITAGNGELHEGFLSASNLVIDRIAGYITTRGIKGRVKIWISGFSRAAAVANLTAGLLTRVGAFPKEDVYAYTYATPAAVLNPPETGDENIYNIICPTDVVPQVMPAEWNYGRYGKDLFLPVPEFTILGENIMKEREAMIRAAFGLDIHYSAALNLRMRLLLSLAYEAIGSRENYVQNIQDTAVGILQKKDASNLLVTMRNMLLSTEGSDRETRGRLDGLINYLIRVFGNAITRTELAAVNRNSGSAMFLLFTEHREDAYMASTGLMLDGQFEEDSSFTYVMVKGPVEMELTIDDVPGWFMTLTEKGSVLVRHTQDGETRTDPEYQDCYMERIGDVSIAAIPRDMNMRVRWKAVSDGTVEVRQVVCGLRASSRYPGAVSGPLKVCAGDTGAAWLPEQNDGVLPEGFREETYLAADMTAFLGISAPFVSWRFLAAGVFLLVGLVVFLIIRLVSLLLPNREKQGGAVWCLLALFCVAAVEAEGAFWLLADSPAIRFAWKAAAAAAVLAVFFLRRDRSEKLLDGVFPGLAAAAAADLLRVRAFLPGMALLLAAHVLLIVSFQRKQPIGRARWIQWAVLSAVTAGLIIFAFVPRFGTQAWTAAACAPVLLLLAYSVSRQPQRVRWASGALLASDLLLGAYLTFWSDPLAHILSTALFSISLMLLALRKEQRAATAVPAVSRT